MEHAGAERIVDTLTWQSAVRSDLHVAERLLAGDDPDGVYSISHSRIVDHFLFFVEEMGVGDALRALRPGGVKREAIPAEWYTVLYFLRCLARIPSQEALPDLLFSDSALMLRLGFNAHQVELGITRRGASRRQGARRNAPVDPEAISKNVAKLDLDSVRPCVRHAHAEGPLGQAPDGVPEGPVRHRRNLCRTRRKHDGRGEDRSVEGGPDHRGDEEEWTVGFKMVWMWSVETGLPVAIGFGTAERDERPFVPALLQQAREVLGERGTIGTVLIDRGFLDGPDLWALNEAGIRFVIPARHDLRVYQEARRAAANDVPTASTLKAAPKLCDVDQREVVGG
jgi:hypothetical protein